MTSPDTAAGLTQAAPPTDHRSTTRTFLSRPPTSRRFFSVAEVADMSGISSVTLYRAINAGEFPAVRVRGRVIVPARVLDALIEAAVEGGSVVDAGSYVIVRREGGTS